LGIASGSDACGNVQKLDVTVFITLGVHVGYLAVYSSADRAALKFRSELVKHLRVCGSRIETLGFLVVDAVDFHNCGSSVLKFQI